MELWQQSLAASLVDPVALARHFNLDPAALYAPPEAVRRAARATLDAFGPHPGHIFNLGHGIGVGTPVESVEALVDEVLTYSKAQRKNSGSRP